jgi:hypothetical protein
MIQFTRSRFYAAEGIQGGACNISGIAHALVSAANAARDEGVQPAKDPAVRLIVHQLAFLARTGDVDDHWSELMDAVKAGHALAGLFDLLGSVVRANQPVDQAAE